ncbi:MAG: hypothetical protein JWP36_591 [Paucimonas sp.]|nr:hypothetical protein [Paucimonas sp.]
MDTPQSSTGSVKDRAQQALQDTRDKAEEGIDQATRAIKPAVERLTSMASDASSAITDRATKLYDSRGELVANTRQQIREKPMAALAIAAAAGFLLRQIFKSRSRRD